jgi:hypothetical protein
MTNIEPEYAIYSLKFAEKEFVSFRYTSKDTYEYDFLFAIETSGGLGRQAREFVKLLAKMSGGKRIGWTHRSFCR